MIAAWFGYAADFLALTPMEWQAFNWILAVVLSTPLVIGIVLVAWSQWRVRNRPAMLQQLAQKLHLTYHAGREKKRIKPPIFRPFSRRGWRVVDVIAGRHHGLKLLAGDFIRPVNDEQTNLPAPDGPPDALHPPFSFCCVRLKPGPQGKLHIRPEHATDRVRDVSFWPDIDFESDEFSRQYRVCGPNRKFAYNIVTPRNMELLLDHPGFTVEVNRFGVMVSRGHGLWSSKEFHSAIKLAEQFCRNIPEFMLSVATADRA